MSDFVHLHVHTHFSLLDGACRIEDLIAAANADGMPALAVTDHGNLFGAIKFYEEAEHEGVKPIIGYEAYVAERDRRNREMTRSNDAGYHLTLLAMNPVGFRNLTKLASTAYLDGFYRKPRIDKTVLAEHNDGLICLSGCASSELCARITEDRLDEAEAVVRAYADLFGDRFYVELQDNSLDIQRKCNEASIEIAGRLGIPLVATNDIHYMRPDDAFAHEVLLCINTGKKISDPSRMQFNSKEFYFRTGEEMADRFRHVPEAVRNTLVVAERCNLALEFGRRHPVFTPPEGKTCEQYLRELCARGLRERYGKVTPEARERLNTELSVIERMGYSAYFLIVWDFVSFARRQNIPNALRGSGVGAMVSYVLYLSDIDPLGYDLLFERFLDPERREPPDLDIDICEIRREEVLNYVKDEYGHECTAQIITFGTLAARGCLRDVGRVLEIPLPDVDRIAKLVPETLGIKLAEALEQEPELKRLYETDPRVQQLFDTAMKLEGLARHAGTHAAGLVMADRDLTDYIPLYVARDVVMSQFDMVDLEKAGMLKMDFLGLRTLTIVDKCVQLVGEREGRRIDMAALDLDDGPTYELLGRGDTEGVFQLGSEGIRDLLRKLKPRNMGDIIALLALYRPGPLGSGMLDAYIERRHGRQPIPEMHPDMAVILEDTFGIITYQEQIMRICNRVADVPLCDALTLIKAIGKKRADKIETGRAAFIEGAVKNGMTEDRAQEIFNLISEFAGYGFNRAHATAYAFLAYRTAYLKANYPVEFAAAGMTCDMGVVPKLVKHIEDAAHLGIEVLGPSVNESMPYFTVTGDGHIRYGLAALRGVGVRATEALVAERDANGPYRSLDDFCSRVDLGAINRAAVEALVKAGAMDGLPGARAQKLAHLEAAMRVGQRLQKDRRQGQMSLFDAFGAPEDEAPEDDLPDIEEWAPLDLLAYEKEALGFYMSGHPLVQHRETLEQLASCRVGDLDGQAAESGHTLGGMVASVKRTTTKKGDPMARIEFEDLSGKVGAVVFPGAFQRCGGMLQEGAILFVQGTVDKSMDRVGFKVEEVVSLEDGRARLTAGASIRLERTGLERDGLVQLRRVCERHAGPTPLAIDIGMPEGHRVRIRAGREMKVAVSERFTEDLAALIGPNRLRLIPQRYEPPSNSRGNGGWGRRGRG